MNDYARLSTRLSGCLGAWRGAYRHYLFRSKSLHSEVYIGCTLIFGPLMGARL
jgi:hypothetical protein